MAKQDVKEENKEKVVEVKEIMPITHDYNREDLNELRDKVNELIKANS